MLQTKISVIVPVYNGVPYLEKCLESIVKQTYPYLQIILVDDGSTDSSGKICDFYAERDSRIEVFHTDNRGLVAARKLGLAHAEGEYAGFVDGDDYIEADMYETLLNEILKSGADFVHTGFIRETGGFRETVLSFKEGVYELPDSETREKFLEEFVLGEENNCRISYSIWSKLYKRDLIQNSYALVKDNQQYGEDLLSLCFCILQSRRISLGRHALYHYAVKEKSMSHLQGRKYALKEVELCGNLIQTIYGYDKKLYTNLEESLYGYIARKLLTVLEKINISLAVPRFYFRNIVKLTGKRVVIYGAGGVGRDYYTQMSRCKEIELIAWVDSDWGRIRYGTVDISDPDRLDEYIFDKIIIAVRERKMAEEIRNMLLMQGQPEEKILWEKPGNIFCSE